MEKLRQTNGRLILSANHIGNPQDIPPRALEWLKKADLVVFEEDRPARQTLKAAGVERPYLKFNEHYQKDSIAAIENAFKQGQTVSYMSDQGIPNLADPGQKILEVAYRLKAQVTVIPGPSSVTAALCACPFFRGTFSFLGFPPKRGEERRRFFQKVLESMHPTVLLETPYRLQATFEQLSEFKSTRQVFLALDITGPNERYFLGRFHEILPQVVGVKENFVLIIDGI